MYSFLFKMLEDLSQKNNWGAPIYTLHSTVISDGQLFLYKVKADNEFIYFNLMTQYNIIMLYMVS